MAVPLQIRPCQSAISEAEARILWVEQTQAVMVALDALMLFKDLNESPGT